MSKFHFQFIPNKEAKSPLTKVVERLANNFGIDELLCEGSETLEFYWEDKLFKKIYDEFRCVDKDGNMFSEYPLFESLYRSESRFEERLGYMSLGSNKFTSNSSEEVGGVILVGSKIDVSATAIWYDSRLYNEIPALRVHIRKRNHSKKYTYPKFNINNDTHLEQLGDSLLKIGLCDTLKDIRGTGLRFK